MIYAGLTYLRIQSHKKQHTRPHKQWDAYVKLAWKLYQKPNGKSLQHSSTG